MKFHDTKALFKADFDIGIEILEDPWIGAEEWLNY